MNIGPMHFHKTLRVHAYPIPTADGISLHVEHENGNRLDQVNIFRCPQRQQLLDMFPAPSAEEPNVFSPLPSLHGPVLEEVSPHRIRFEGTTLRFFP